MERTFLGIWIPREIWLNTDLSLQDKVFLVEVTSLSKTPAGCYAQNNYFAEFFGLSKERVRRVIAGLVKKGLLISEIDHTAGNIRFLKIPKTAFSEELRPPMVENYHRYGRKQPYPMVENNRVLYKEDNTIDNIVYTHISIFHKLWNSKAALPTIKTFTPARVDKFIEAMKQKTFADNYPNIIENLAKSKYHTGQTSRSDWRATVDWLLDPDHWAQILELAPAAAKKKDRGVCAGCGRPEPILDLAGQKWCSSKCYAKHKLEKKQ